LNELLPKCAALKYVVEKAVVAVLTLMTCVPYECWVVTHCKLALSSETTFVSGDRILRGGGYSVTVSLVKTRSSAAKFLPSIARG